MNPRSIIDIRNANGWILATSIAANMAWSIFSLLIAYYFLGDSEEAVFLMQIAVLWCAFGGPFIIGWLCGWLAFDDRGVTYGVVGALGSVLVILFTFLASGGIAILRVHDSADTAASPPGRPSTRRSTGRPRWRNPARSHYGQRSSTNPSSSTAR